MISFDGKNIVSGSYDKSIKVWNLETGEEIKTLIGDNKIACVAISNDGKYIISGVFDDNSIKVWNLDKWYDIKNCRGHLDYVLSVVISNDG